MCNEKLKTISNAAVIPLHQIGYFQLLMAQLSIKENREVLWQVV